MSKLNNLILYTRFSVFIISVFAFLFTSCATTAPQYGKNTPSSNRVETSSDSPVFRFFLTGNIGGIDPEDKGKHFEALKHQMADYEEESMLLILGNNVFPQDMNEGFPERETAEQQLQTQIDLADSFKGQTVFIPGNYDWGDFDALIEEEKFITQKLGDQAFFPKNGCALESLSLTDSLELILVDSQWYLENWDRTKEINRACKIKTREEFFEDFEKLLMLNQNKTIVIAQHHPLITHGNHGGQTSFRQQFFPFDSKLFLPVLGSLINLTRATSGIVFQDTQNKVYREFSERIETIVGGRENVVFVSAHDRNLQYIEKEYIRQIISGSAFDPRPARVLDDVGFSYGGHGFAVLDIFPKGRSVVRFYEDENGKEKLLFEKEVTHRRRELRYEATEDRFPERVNAQIYPDELTHKSRFYTFLFGDHYRKYYSLPVNVPVLDLNSFQGGVTPYLKEEDKILSPLILNTSDGKEFVMRPLKKNATGFLQGKVFKTQYVEKDLEGTATERFVMDFYTSGHPYYPLMISELSGPLGIYHTDPQLYFIPKQSTLGFYNESYGDELYIVEEKPGKGFSDQLSFGYPKDVINTDELLSNLRKHADFDVDKELLIRARLFDMLIGDWDRNEDSWNWAEFEEDGKTIYRPIPLGRGQIFPKYSGVLTYFILQLPLLYQRQTFGPELKTIRDFNWEAYSLDMALLHEGNLEDWRNQAKYIQTHLTDSLIDNAFRNIPDEVKDKNVERIKRILKKRKIHLTQYAEEYYKILARKGVVFATDHKDSILVTRLPMGRTKVELFDADSGELLPYFQKVYHSELTKEIWIYGLNGKDVFVVSGEGDRPILLRLIGGDGDDDYRILNGRKVRIYDFHNQSANLQHAKKASIRLSRDYSLNRYDYRKPNFNDFYYYPLAGYNPDNGLKLGMHFSYTFNGFVQKPYTSSHDISAHYYFATHGVEVDYRGIFANLLGKWKLRLNVYFTSPAFSVNFFGFGNNTPNYEKELGMDYNRVRMQTLRVTPSVFWESRRGSRLEMLADLADIQVDKTQGRITETSNEIKPEVFSHHIYSKMGVMYSYKNYDNASLPTMGLDFKVSGIWTATLSQSGRNFPFVSGHVNIFHKLSRNERLVLSTGVSGKHIFNNNFHFFEAASIGDNHGLRGYRDERFIGRTAFIQTSDLRLYLAKTTNAIVPLKFGVIAGYDYGRVWMDGERSGTWHHDAGGGVWVNALSLVTGQVNYFYGSDGGRFSFTFRMNF